MTIPITTSTLDSQMHNNIMAAGSRDRLPMLATGRYAQWQSRFIIYVDTKPNDDTPAVEEQTVLEKFSYITPENKAYYDVKKEAIKLILIGIEDDIYSTVNARKTAHEMWIAIERLQQEQADLIEDMDKELDEHELEAHYIYMAKIHEVYTIDTGPSFDDEPLEEADQNAKECDDERAVLANLITNLKLDTDEIKKMHKQLKKENTSLSHELQKCKSALEECKSSLENSNRTQDRCIIALQNKEIELEKYKTYHNRTIKHDTLERKLKDTLKLLAQKEHDIKEGLKIKAYEIYVVKEKHDEFVKQSLLTKSRYEGLVKEKNKVIKDLKLEEKTDLDKLIAMEKQLNFLNETIYKQNQSIQTIHMLAPKGSTYNGRLTFANPMCLKKAQSEKPCLYEILYDTSDPANIFTPEREETLTLQQESRSKLNKDLVKPYDYTKQNRFLNHHHGNILISWHTQMKFERKCRENLL
nr:hypothetical protein [Tanacetum cinerariifolium]